LQMSVRKKQELVLLRRILIHISEVWPDELNEIFNYLSCSAV
jgi:hypothetical protein